LSRSYLAKRLCPTLFPFWRSSGSAASLRPDLTFRKRRLSEPPLEVRRVTFDERLTKLVQNAETNLSSLAGLLAVAGEEERQACAAALAPLFGRLGELIRLDERHCT
jgi:hypothetical protein